jgi:hypothetical protein
MLNGITEAVPHRESISAVDSGLPDPSPNGDYLENPGAFTVARLFIHGTSAGAAGAVQYEIEPWIKRHGQHILHGALCEPARFAGNWGADLTGPTGVDNDHSYRNPIILRLDDHGEGDWWWAVDVPANGDDIFARLYQVDGAPSSFALDMYVSWRGSDA